MNDMVQRAQEAARKNAEKNVMAWNKFFEDVRKLVPNEVKPFICQEFLYGKRNFATTTPLYEQFTIRFEGLKQIVVYVKQNYFDSDWNVTYNVGAGVHHMLSGRFDSLDKALVEAYNGPAPKVNLSESTKTQEFWPPPVTRPSPSSPIQSGGSFTKLLKKLFFKKEA